MDHKKTSDSPQQHLDRRSFLDGAGRLAVGGLAVGAIFETIRPTFRLGPAAGEGDAPDFRPRCGSAQDPLHVSDFGRRGDPGAGPARSPVRRWRAESTSSKWGRRCSRPRALRTSCPPSASSFPTLSCWRT